MRQRGMTLGVWLAVLCAPLTAIAQPDEETEEEVEEDAGRSPPENRIKCENGDLDACEELARAYRTGEGVRPSPGRAAMYFLRACDSGRATACAEQAAVMRESTDERLSRDAGRYELKACVLGLGASCRRLARGQTPPRHAPRKLAERAAKACKAGDPFLCVMHAHLAAAGLGTARDAAGAAETYRRACDLRLSWGCWALSRAYQEGVGVKRDTARAGALGRQACSMDRTVCRLTGTRP